MSEIKNILIICYSYYPDNTPRAYRWTSIAESLTKNNFNVDVICSNSLMKKSTFEIINKVNVYRILDISKNVNHYSTPIKTTQSYFSFIKYIVKKIFLIFRWPDYAFLWIIPAINKANQLLKNNNYNTLITVAHPFSSHIVGLFLNRRNLKGKWICDYGDPYSVDYHNKKYLNIFNNIIEKYLIHKSNIICVTNNNTKNLYINKLSILPDKIQIINPLLSKEPTNFIDIGIDTSKNINLVYTGTFYKNIRNPKYLINFFTQLTNKSNFNFSLHIFGNLGDCNEYFNNLNPDSKIYIHGIVSRDELFNLYDSQTILVNIENVSNFQTPSKIVEYINTGLIILNIFNKEKIKDSNNIIYNYNKTISISNQDNIEDNISIFLDFLLKYSSTISNKLDIIQPYKLESILKEYIQLTD